VQLQVALHRAQRNELEDAAGFLVEQDASIPPGVDSCFIWPGRMDADDSTKQLQRNYQQPVEMRPQTWSRYIEVAIAVIYSPLIGAALAVEQGI
jgi:hypothetical protein